jgi:hypothetical protein
MRIQVHPESLREVARTFNRQSAAIQEIEEELCRAIGGLDTWAWDGRSRARAEPLLGRVGPEGRTPGRATGGTGPKTPACGRGV